MSGRAIVELIEEWAHNKGMHPDDFSDLFVEELLEMMEEDE